MATQMTLGSSKMIGRRKKISKKEKKKKYQESTPHSWQRPPHGARCFTVGTIFTFRHHVKNSFFIHVLSSKCTFILAHDLRGLIPKAHPNLYLSKKHGREIIVYRILPKKIHRWPSISPTTKLHSNLFDL